MAYRGIRARLPRRGLFPKGGGVGRPGFDGGFGSGSHSLNKPVNRLYSQKSACMKAALSGTCNQISVDKAVQSPGLS